MLMRLNIFIFLALSTITLLFSCKEYQCSKADLRFGLIGFSDAEADTIILRRFDKTNPTTPKDTFLLTERFKRRSDTLEMVAFSSNALMQSDYTYEIIIPQSGSFIRIIEIAEEQRSIRLGLTDKVGCVNFITSCKLNDQVTSVSDNDVYLKK